MNNNWFSVIKFAVHFSVLPLKTSQKRVTSHFLPVIFVYTTGIRMLSDSPDALERL
jgi:hypothetical protein